MNSTASQNDMKSAKSIFWASLAVLFFVIGAMVTSLYPIFREMMELEAEIGFGGWPFFLPGIICLVIGNYMSWDVVIALTDRITPFFGGKGGSSPDTASPGVAASESSADDNPQEDP